MKTQLYDWQKTAFEMWKEHNSKGIIKGVTGSGKTLIALKAIEEALTQKDSSVLVVVPTIHLQDQWKKFMLYEGIIDENDIGLLGGGNYDRDKRVLIAVVNSVREIVYTDIELLIADEVHREMSAENCRFIYNGEFNKILGLSATPEREDDAHLSIYQYAPLIYTYTHKQASEDGVICPFEIINIAVELTPTETEIIDRAQASIDKYFPEFGNNFDYVKKSIGRTPTGVKAAILMRAFSKRRQTLLHAANKIDKVTEILSLTDYQKAIIFCEYIKTAEQIKKNISHAHHCFIYHSGMKLKDKQRMLDEFKNVQKGVMISVKALDEGLNTPAAEIGIVVAGSSVDRQIIQRLGRILRNEEGKKAILYQLYVPDTKDSQWLKKRSREINSAATSVRWN